MKIIQRDITTIDDGVIFHQVNCQGVMRSGVAKAIREKWPEVFSEYSKFCQNKTPEELLGTYNAVNLSDEYIKEYMERYFAKLLELSNMNLNKEDK